VETIALSPFLLLAVVISGALARMSPVPVPLLLVQVALGAAVASIARFGIFCEGAKAARLEHQSEHIVDGSDEREEGKPEDEKAQGRAFMVPPGRAGANPCPRMDA